MGGVDLDRHLPSPAAMSSAAVQAVEPRPAAATATATAAAAVGPKAAATQPAARGCGGTAAVAAGKAATMEHVLLALRETEAEREERIRAVFAFFDAAGRGHLDHAQIVAGLAALRVPEGGPEAGAGAEDYARALLRGCDRDRDGRVGYDDFRRYMDDKELELYRIFQAIDVEHNGCILPEELWHALVKAGNRNATLSPSLFERFLKRRSSISAGGASEVQLRFSALHRHCFCELQIRYLLNSFRLDVMRNVADKGDNRSMFAGIEIGDEELARFVEHVDKDNDGIITFEEWRDFLLLYPHEATIENIYHHWERVCLVDIGEQAAIPEGISKHVGASKYLIAGGIAGAASRTATAPLDRLKVNMQVQTNRTTVAHAVKSIWRDGGLLGFFRGNGLNVVKVAPESAIRFYTYEMLKEYIMKSKGEEKSDIGTSGRLMAGGLAGAVAQTAIYPIDLVKTRLQTYEGGRIPSLGALSRDIWIHEGPRAFYRGLVPSLLGMVPYAGIDLTLYETLKEMSKTYVLKDSGTLLLPESAHAFTLTSQLVPLSYDFMIYVPQCVPIHGFFFINGTYRMQAQPANSEDPYRGMTDCFRRTLRREGISGFYKGLVPNLLKVVPAASITYLVYETMKKSLSLD
ncbi:hypothetical protein HU200_040583 [Digitaria exilis]|uniref:EF-hand domain-containing protein n=1 Tax=Digitaria exilis TaxID=1010633 RepID=A0A835B8X2_9POAL|nr:hypothetical protein HU200_040583 [Digitaria exilis]